VSADKGKGVLGEVDLNLSDYTEGDFNILKLALKNCADPDGYIEVGLKGTPVKEKKAHESSAAGGTGTPKASVSGKEIEANKQQMIQIL
jgi:hypothetical protein